MAEVSKFLAALCQKLAAAGASHITPPCAARRARPSNVVLSSMRGDIVSLEAQPDWLDLDEQQRVIRFFVSSTFDDTKHERDVLICCVMPALQTYGRSRGFEIVMSEMRFGIRKSSSDDHKTTDLCMSELERCLQSSAGISYILLNCDRYGFRMPPCRIPAIDMDGLLACMTSDERLVALDFYSLDENVLRSPQECYNIDSSIHCSSDAPGPAYVIKNANALPRFWERFGTLQTILRGAAARHWPDSPTHACDPYSRHPCKFFSFSITEEEISRGLFWRSPGLIRDSVLVLQRSLQASDGSSLQSMNASSPELKNYIDLSSDKTTADLDASRCLIAQQQMITRAISNNLNCLHRFQPLEWQDGKGLDPLHLPHANYLHNFAELCLSRLLHSIDSAYEKLAVKKHDEMAESIFHLKFARERSLKFAHSSNTQPVSESLAQYLSAQPGCRRAFVICGASGSGKTYLMAQSVDSEARATHGRADAALICRFLGTSPASSSVLLLLKSICNQLAALSPELSPCHEDADGWQTASDSDECSHSASDSNTSSSSDSPSSHSHILGIESDFEKLQVYFKNALQNWSHGRLVIFLDSLDQLDDSLGGRRLNWLPTHDLAPGVRLVVSTLPDDASPADGKPFACWSTLQARYSDSSCFVHVQPVDDVAALCLHLMKFQKRKLTVSQLQVVDAVVKKSPKTQTPLVVTILATRLGDWPSHAVINPDTIDASSVRALIIQEFKALEVRHGADIVHATLSFITIAKDGVSETELFEILSLDDDVLAAVYEWWVPPVRTLPTSPLTILLADLKPYLTRRGAASGHGSTTIRWYHRQFWEAANDYFLQNTSNCQRRHAQLAEFFLGSWANRSKMYNDRLKTAVQKKVAGEVSGDRRVRPQPLCMRDGCSIFQAKKDVDSVNTRRCRELGHHLLAAGMLCEAADELCSFEGICARMMCGEELTLNQQLRTLALQLQEQVRRCNVRAWQQLQRVEHYARWLQRDITTIVLDPQAQIFLTCSQQPEISLARKELLKYMQLTSSPVLSYKQKHSCHRSFLLGLSPQEFDACVSELKYHQRQVYCVAYNSNSSMLASASSDNSVGLWNVTTGTLEGVIKGHTDTVSSVAWAPDCRHIITGSHDQTAKIWDTLTLKEVASLHHSQQSCVNSVDWSSKGNYVASGCSATKNGVKKSAKSSIKLWGAKHFDCKGTLNGHTDAVVSVAFDCTERFLASSSRDMTIRVWNVQSMEQVALLLGHTGVVAAVAFDPSGRYIASCSHDMSVRIWDALRYEEVTSLTGHTEEVRCISWDRSGRYVASGAGIDRTPCFDTTIRVWDVHARKNVTTLTGCKYTVNAVSFDCTGRYIASVSSIDNTVCIWDLKTPLHAHKFKGNYFTLAWTCSGKYILASKVTLNSSIRRGIASHESRLSAENLTTKMEDFVIQVFDAYTGSTVAKISGHTHVITAIDVENTGKFFASGSKDQTVRLWDASSFKEIAVLQGHTGDITTISFNINGMYLASGSSDCTIRVWNVQDHQIHAVLRGHDDSTDFVAWIRGGNVLLSRSKTTLCTWDALAFHKLSSVECPSEMSDISALDAARRYIASALNDKEDESAQKKRQSASKSSVTNTKYAIAVWDTLICSNIALLRGHVAIINCLAWDSQGMHIVSGSNDKSVRVWDVFRQQQLAVLMGHIMSVTSVAFDCLGKYIVSSAYDGTIRLWDVHHHQTDVDVATIRGGIDPDSIDFISEGKFIAAMFPDSTVHIMHPTTLELLVCVSNWTGTIETVSFSSSSSMVAIVSADGRVRVCRAPSGELLAPLAVVAAASCIAWSNTEGLILLGMQDGSICVSDVSTGLQNTLLKCPQVAAVTKVIVSPDYNLMAAVIESLFHVHVFSLLSSALLVSLTFSGDSATLQWSISGCILQDDGKDLWKQF